MKDEWGDFKDLDRRLVADAWKCHRAGEPVEGDLAEVVYAMQHHAEWSHVWDSLSTAQDTGVEIQGEDGPFNPLLHVHMDSVVKRQLDQNEPKAIKGIYHLLESQGFEEFDAIHVIARALVGELWEIMKHQRPFDQARYVSKAKRNRSGGRA
jgi:hypothetical protein